MSTSNINEYAFIKKLAMLPFVEQIWLFGSRARGDNAERADIDLAIVCPKATNIDWQQVIAIVYTADTLLKIDCVRFDKFKQNIIQFKKILYEKGEDSMQPIFLARCICIAGASNN